MPFPCAKLFCASFIHSVFGVTSIFYITAVSLPQVSLQQFTNGSFYAHYGVALSANALDWVWSTTVASLVAGSILGGPMLDQIVVRFGSRDAAMIWHNLLVMAASAIHLIAFPTNCFELIVVGRFLAGIAFPLAYWTGIFITECAPIKFRGIASAPTAVGKSVWTVLGAALGVESILGTPSRLPYLMAVPAIPAFIHICSTFFFPKSPKELYIAEGDTAGATAAIRFYHGEDADVAAVLKEFDSEAELCRNVRQVSVSHILRRKVLYMPFFLCIAIYLSYNFGGGDAVAFYSAHILTKSGMAVNARTAAVVCTIPSVFISIICMAAVRVIGRRPVVLFSLLSGDLGVLLFLIAIQLASSVPSISSILGIIGLASCMCAIAANEMVSTILPGELCPLGSRALSTAWATIACAMTSFVTTIVYLPAESALGGYVFLPFFLVNSLLTFFVWRHLPETKMKTVAAIVQHWHRKDSVSEKSTLIKDDQFY